MTKTVGKVRDDKKSCDNSTFPKTRRRKATDVNHEVKECFSENDLCNGDDYDCVYDYEYEDNDDDEDDDDDNNTNEDRGQEKEQDDSGGIQEQTNGSAAERCNGKRYRNKRRSVNRVKVEQDGAVILESKKASSRLHGTNSNNVTTNKQSQLENSVEAFPSHSNLDIGKQEVVVSSKAEISNDEQPGHNSVNETVHDK